MSASPPSASGAQASPSPVPAPRTSNRARALLILAAIVGVAATVWGGYWAMYLRGWESTDNAYVHAPMVQITAQQAGTVVAVLAEDTQAVKAGQILVKLDAADARLALERAEAQLGQAVREARVLYVNDGALFANIRLKEAEVDRMQTEVVRARDNLARRKPLLESGAIGAEEVRHAEAALASAQGSLAGAKSALEAAREQAAGNRALTQGTPIDRHPNVQRAAIAVREAWLAAHRVDIPAPLGGQVARRTAQVGQRVAPGTVLMSVVPLDQVWIEANFKEVQLREMRVGQKVVLEADLWGNKVNFDGRLAGLGAATGAAFAVLPAQNASGNWVKVVQRIPVRIEIDSAQLKAHPLRVGLSMHVHVDVSDRSGGPLTAPTPPRRVDSTEVFGTAMEGAERRIEEIIARNLEVPRGTPAGRPAARSDARPDGASPGPRRGAQAG